MTDIPFGLIENRPFILQGNDQYYDTDCESWISIGKHFVGKWSDDCFEDDVKIRGYLFRLSDAVHPCRFQAVYGRPKPSYETKIQDDDVVTEGR